MSRKRMPALEAADIVALHVKSRALAAGKTPDLAMCEDIINAMCAGDLGSSWLRYTVAPRANAKTVLRLAKRSIELWP